MVLDMILAKGTGTVGVLRNFLKCNENAFVAYGVNSSAAPCYTTPKDSSMLGYLKLHSLHSSLNSEHTTKIQSIF